MNTSAGAAQGSRLSVAPGPHTLRAELERELAAVFRVRADAANAYGSQFVRLWTLAGESVLGGKMLRPFLFLDVYAELLRATDASPKKSGAETPPLLSTGDGASDCVSIVSIAASIELLHYSFLLHDDVIDGDLTRRGKPNLIGALLAESAAETRDPEFTSPARDATRDEAILHWSRSGGILMGDLLLASTHQTFARAQLSHATRVRLLDLLDHTITESVAGEQLDVGLGDGMISPDLATILSMSASKTATYTFELPLRAAAILAGQGPRMENALAAAGRHLGLAFQLQDDLLSTFGDPALHGKDTFSDLREGKQTALIAFARMTSAWPSIEPLFGQASLSVEDGARVQQLLSDCGAEDFMRGLVDEQLRAFSEVLANSPAQISAGVQRILLQLAGRLEGRNS